ncbi:unnamed protein product [Darwinula stevensoni]|uniref:Protein YIPF n=1 Tax=Darwinula stevensoni TaxID=69355 RepID=A0A7R9AH30_9CRUS|nr:unnamed protein product [Darwinula stevensoni]CAG0904302.1 unnamed protein product [Darwinula stevensoni]
MKTSGNADMNPDMGIDLDEGVEGELTVPGEISSRSTHPGGKPEYNTLDEPIKETVLDENVLSPLQLRDLRAVGSKFYHVLYPKQKKALLKDWDLWGPLILCSIMAMMLQESTHDANRNDHGGPEFAEVFVIVWIGSIIVTVNSKLLGGTLSFFQSVCVLGYCLLPPAIALLLCRIILFWAQTSFLFALRFLIAILGFTWATYASLIFLGDSQPPTKRFLALYPIFLFYFVISWLIISHTHI